MRIIKGASRYNENPRCFTGASRVLRSQVKQFQLQGGDTRLCAAQQGAAERLVTVERPVVRPDAYGLLITGAIINRVSTSWATPKHNILNTPFDNTGVQIIHSRRGNAIVAL